MASLRDVVQVSAAPKRRAIAATQCYVACALGRSMPIVTGPPALIR